MVESSDLQGAIQRTQAMERIQQLQSQQEEMNRKRFELEIARERAEKGEKVLDSHRAASKRVVRDRFDRREQEDSSQRGDEDAPATEDSQRRGQEQEPGPEDGPAQGGNLDVRV